MYKKEDLEELCHCIGNEAEDWDDLLTCLNTHSMSHGKMGAHGLDGAGDVALNQEHSRKVSAHDGAHAVVESLISDVEVLARNETPFKADCDYLYKKLQEVWREEQAPF